MNDGLTLRNDKDLVEELWKALFLILEGSGGEVLGFVIPRFIIVGDGLVADDCDGRWNFSAVFSAACVGVGLIVFELSLGLRGCE